MFLFIRLLLAHFIGDFPLQFNKIFELKHKGLKGGLPHALLVVICLIVFSWPYLKIPALWGFIVFISITHLFQDSIKISYGKIKYSFWFYLLDQLLHIAAIAIGIIFFTDLKNAQPPQPQNASGFIATLYNNDTVIIYLIAIIIATYNGFYLIRSFKNTFLNGAGKYNSFEKWYGMLERTAIVSIFFVGGFFLFLIPVIILIRPLTFYIGRRSFVISKQFVSATDMVLSWMIGGTTGIALYIAIPRFY